jgi:hypothetical protein
MALRWGYFKVWLARAAKPRFRWRGRFVWLTAKKETKRHVRAWHFACRRQHLRII